MALDASSGYAAAINGSQDAEQQLPIFDVQRVQLRFDISADFVAAQVANNVLILALSSGRVLRFDLDNTEDIDDIDLPKKPAEVGVIRKLFLDPSASHLIISTALGENYYLHTQSRQPKTLSRLKGIQIECVAWNPLLPTASTREILIGASDGNIYETYIEPSTDYFRREEKYLKNVYHSSDGPVVGLWADAVDGRPEMRRVLVATPEQLFHFAGRTGRSGNDSNSIYTRLFENEAPTVQNAPQDGQAGPSSLSVAPDAPDVGPSSHTEQSRAFAWLGRQSVFSGTLSSAQPDPSGAFGDTRVLPRSRLPGASPNARGKEANQPISSMTLTHFHILNVIGNRLVGVNRLDNSVVFDQSVLEAGQTSLGLHSDLKKNTYWIFTQRDIFEIVVTDEDRDVWRIMLDRQQFDLAAKHARTASQKDAVSIATGDHLVKKGNYIDAATAYGKSSKAFEEVALVFIDHAEQDALRKYLLAKLGGTKRAATMQRILLASWLIELFMAKLNILDDTISANTDVAATGRRSSMVKEDLPTLRREFQSFVTKYKGDLDRKTTYELISSHGREEELLYYANVIDDFSYVLSYWIQRERWQEAMSVLKKQTNPDIFYQHSSVLMAHVPMDLVEVMMRQPALDAKQLIPALLNYNKAAEVPLSQNQAVRYLLFCINQHHTTEADVHNTLISIYASDATQDESALLSYLQTQSAANEQNYDADFALRLCNTYNRVQSAVHVYCTMSQFSSAVDTALRNDQVELAAQVADRPENDPALRKKLWLKVAKKVISQSAGMKSAMDFLKRCELLRIEDLIPFFPDFVVIDDFKEDICAALENYSRQIDDLRREMDNSADTAQHIRDDIKALDARYAIVEPGERCYSCRLPLLMRQFFVFPCQHAFHADCLGKMVTMMAGTGKGKRIKELQAEISKGVATGKKKERLVKELDGLVAGACVLCSEMAVKMIDEPFVKPEDNKDEWTI